MAITPPIFTSDRVLWRNLIAIFSGSIWTAILGLAVVPFYIRYLGMEAYGLMGFFLALQAALGLLDLGLAPTISREVARCGVMGKLTDARHLLRTLAVIYWCIAATIGSAIVLAAPWIGTRWLQASTLAPDTIMYAGMLTGIIIALRFPVGLYAGVLQGAQRQRLGSAISAGVATVASLGGVLLIVQVSNRIESFLLWQAVVALIHVGLIRRAAWRALEGHHDARFDRAVLRSIWRFSAGMGAVAILGTILTQLDRLVLSRTVGLADLGRYTLAWVAARSLILIVASVSGAIYPQLSALVARGDTIGIARIYTLGTRLLLAFLFPIALFIGVFSVDLFTLWSGNAETAKIIRPVVGLLTLGTALNAVMTFPFALQLAYGLSRLPAIIAAVLIVGFIPLLLTLVPVWGIVGAAASWAILNAAYVPLGAWLTHRTLLRSHGWSWFIGDVGVPFTFSLVMVGGGGWLVTSLTLPPIARLALGGLLAILSFMLVAAATPAFWTYFGAWRNFGRRRRGSMPIIDPHVMQEPRA